ncbi:HNH endonuclease [Nocardia colli]|uniref:HNH endonuclease n=1 Tax=Nocardia colli TaxID=2545717 RepID=UPI0035D9885E
MFKRSPLRLAIESGDRKAIIKTVRARAHIDPVSGCHIWPLRPKDAYPRVTLGRRTIDVHRAVLEARLGYPLGDMAAHHRCSVARCVNPDHLQPVTHASNVAEMLARTYYVSRIRALEAALAAVRPRHELLAGNLDAEA